MNAVASITPHAVNGYSSAQLRLIKDTVARDCNPMEFDLFVTVARNAGLDPFRKQISAIVFSKNDAEKRRMSIITTIDGLRVIAARSRRYRPDEDEAAYEIDPSLKGPANPLGLVKATVRIYIADAMREGGWKPVTGVAYWDEFAPIKEEVEGGFDWEDIPNQFHKDTGKPKRRKVPRVQGAKAIPQLDTSGQWGKMPRVMLAKCAEAQALRKAFPEDLSALYEAAEMDQARVVDLTPSEQIEQLQTQDRLLRIGAASGIMFQMFPNAAIESVPLGQVADRVIEAAKGFSSLQQIHWFEGANRLPLQEFWARHPGDALAVKKVLEDERARLVKEAEAAESADDTEQADA